MTYNHTQTETNEIDAVAMQDESLRRRRADRREIVDRVKAMSCETDDLKEAKKHARLLARRAIDARPGKLICFAGYTGVGKSHIWHNIVSQMETALRAADELDRTNDGGPADNETLPVLAIKVPAPCTLKTLGHELLDALGYPIQKNLLEHKLIHRVRQQVTARNVRIIAMDEMHNVVAGRTVTDRQKIAAALKNFLNDPHNPVQIVVAGMPQCTTFIREFSELRRRSEIVEIHPLEQDPNLLKLRRFLSDAESAMALPENSNLTRGDLPERFYAATAGYLGRVAFLVQEAAYLAIDDDRGSITQDDLAVVFAAATGLPTHLNPFRVANTERCPALDPAAWGRDNGN